MASACPTSPLYRSSASAAGRSALSSYAHAAWSATRASTSNSRRSVHDVLRPALEERDHVVDDPGVEEVHPLRRLIGVVGGQHDLLAREQRVIRWQRLVIVDVEG